MPGRWRQRRNWGARISDVVLQGLDAVVLENELLRVTVLAGKGADVVEFNHKPTDTDYCWLTPAGVRDPLDVVPAGGDDVAVFLDSYPGGWQEVFPNAGAPATYRGARLAQHAEVAVLPWDVTVVADEADEVVVRVTVRTPRLPFQLRRTMRLRSGEAVLRVTAEAVNESDVAVDAMWGQHLAYGRPFLRPGCRLRLPEGVTVIPHPEPITPPRRRVAAGGTSRWPEVPAADGGTVDLSLVPEPGTPSDIVYLTGFDDGWYELTDPDAGRGVRVEWDRTLLPYLWLWQEFGASTDHPWWGRGYVLGVEPHSSYPTNGLAEAVRNGSALSFGPREHRVLEWTVAVLG